jgi:hypothetical protein
MLVFIKEAELSPGTCDSMPVSLAIQEAEIRSTAVRSQPGQIVCNTKKKKKSQKKAGVGWGGVGWGRVGEGLKE